MTVLSGRTADHVPRIPILMQFAAEYIGSIRDNGSLQVCWRALYGQCRL
jgi:hypothetical protein